MTLFLGYIAYQQMRTNKDKLKLDLYSKRFEIYSITLKFHQELMAEGLATGTHRKFIEAKQSSKFLFHQKDGIYTCLDKIHKESYKVKACKEKSGDVSEKLSFQMHKDSQEALNLIISEVEALDGKLSNYLNFNK